MELVYTHIVGCFEARAIELDNPVNSLEEAIWGDEYSERQRLRVTNDSAQGLAPWWEAIVGLSNDVAGMPFDVFKRLPGGGTEEDRLHPVSKLLRRRPNKEMTPFSFKHLMMWRMLSWGNAYAYIERTGADVSGLWPLDSESVTPFRADGDLYYYWQDPEGRRETMTPDELFHLRGPGDDGLCGKSMFKVARDALSVGLQAQQYGSRFFENDASPGIVLEFPEAVDEPTARNILKHWSRRHGGARNASRPAFLDRGGKVSPFSISNKDAEFIASRQFSKGEVASFFHLPPHKVGDLSHATFSNIEQQALDYLMYSLTPWLVRWHEECDAKLFRPSEVEAETHFVKLNAKSLRQADFAGQMAGFQIGLGIGIYNHDEVRGLLDMNELPDGLGKQYYHSQNMIPLGTEPPPKPGELPEPPPPKLLPPPAEGKAAAREMFAAFILRELQYAYKRAANAIVRNSNLVANLQAWNDDGIKEDVRELLQAIGPTCDKAAALGIVDLDPANFALTLLADCRAIIAAQLCGDPMSLRSRVEGLAKRMAADRPSQLVAELWS